MDRIKTYLKKSLWRFLKFLGCTFGTMTLISCGLTYLLFQPGNLEAYNAYIQTLAEKYPDARAKVIDEPSQAANIE